MAARLKPPPRFRGDFLADSAALARVAGASGPFRLVPSAVAAPLDLDDLRLLVSWAGRQGVRLVPRGAGTGMPGGNVGRGVVVDLTAWNHVRESANGDLVVGPGAVASEVNRRAGANGRHLAVLPSSADRCTVGGMVANNAAGARSFRFGSIRPWVRELEVLLPDGSVQRLQRGSTSEGTLGEAVRAAVGAFEDLSRGWPQVRKNSSGYAFDRVAETGDAVDLIVGSEGTLAIVTEARLATRPKPEVAVLSLLPVPEEALLDDVVESVAGADPTACEFFGDRLVEVARLRDEPLTASVAKKASALLLIEVGGDPERVQEGVGQIRSLAAGLAVPVLVADEPQAREQLWSVRHAASPVVARMAGRGLHSLQFIEDSVVPSGRLNAYLAGLREILEREETDAVVFGHAGDGNVHVNPLVDVRQADWRSRVGAILESTVDLVSSLGGTLSGEHGDGRVRAPYLADIWGSETVAAFRAVKEVIDPEGLMNPGVVLPLSGQDPLEGISVPEGAA